MPWGIPLVRPEQPLASDNAFASLSLIEAQLSDFLGVRKARRILEQI
jgi:hypothetical protein